MPIRARSHQLEDRSINRFEALLPAEWVMRRKSQDYGVDLEIEIFESDGNPTGLIFQVQIRGTDDLKKRQKLQISLEQMRYFMSLDIPTLVVRYCSDDESFHCQWHANIASEIDAAEGQKSFTKTFRESETWSDGTPATLRATLSTWRLLDNYPSDRLITLKSGTTQLTSIDRYVVERAIDELIETLPDVFCRQQRSHLVTLEISGTEEMLRIGIGEISSISSVVDSYDLYDVLTTILYCSTALIRHHGLRRQASRAAHACLERGRSFRSKALALTVAQALEGDLRSSVRLAILNGLYDQSDASYALYTAFLLTSAVEKVERSEAVKAYYDTALSHARGGGAQAEAAVHYSIANVFRCEDDNLNAIKHLNLARKLRPEYLDVDYFLGELGACFFGTTHYRCAAEAYRREQNITPSARGSLHLGDALLFSGRIQDASLQYDKALQTDDDFLKAEAALKGALCSWMEDWGHQSVAPTARILANAMMDEHDGSPELWAEIIENVDATNELAHFNLGVHWSRIGTFDKALGSFLFCSFKRSGDLESWVNAMICAHSLRDPQILLTVMSAALSLAGRRAYDHLRDLLLEQSAPEGLIEGLDEVAHELNQQVQASRSRDVTLRMISDSHYDVVTVVP